MASEIGKKDQPASKRDAKVKRRGLLRFGTLVAALTGASAVSVASPSSAQAAPGSNAYVPISEKGAPSGVATLDAESKIQRAQFPDLSAMMRDAATSGSSPLTNAKPAGDMRPGVWEYAHNSSFGYLYHLTSGPTMTGGAIVAVGIGDGGPTSATGLLVSQKNGSTGNAVSLVNQPNTPGAALRGTHQSAVGGNPFIALETVNETGKASPLLQLTANGTPGVGQYLLSIDSGAAPLLARGGHGTSILRVHADTGTVDVTAPILRINGGKNRVQSTDIGGTFTNVSHVDTEVIADEPTIRLRRTLGGSNLFHSYDVATTGAVAHLRAAPAAAPGSETPVNAVSWAAAGASPLVGFFGATPVAKPLLTYSRSTENAAQTQLRTALSALGLVTDNTVA